MKRIVRCGLTVAALATGEAALAQADFCGDVRALAAAAQTTPAFASLPHHPESRRMLGFATCLVFREEASRFQCLHPAADALGRDDPAGRGWDTPEDLMARIAECLPQAARSGPEVRYAHGRWRGELVPEDQQQFPQGDFRNNLRNHHRRLFVDAGPVRFEHRTLIHPRVPSYQTLAVYIRDTEAGASGED